MSEKNRSHVRDFARGASSEEGDRLAEMMAAAQGGDELAYEQLLTEVAPIVRACVSRRVFGVSDRDDVVQDILLSIHLARDTFDPARAFLPWMRTIVHHRLVDYFRSCRRRPQMTEVDADTESGLAVSDGIGEASVAFTQAVEALSASQQRLLRMMTDPLVDNDVIGSELNIEPGNLRVQVHRLLQKLKAALE